VIRSCLKFDSYLPWHPSSPASRSRSFKIFLLTPFRVAFSRRDPFSRRPIPGIPEPTPKPLPPPNPSEVWHCTCVINYELEAQPCAVCALGDVSGTGEGLASTYANARTFCEQAAEKSATADLRKMRNSSGCKLGKKKYQNYPCRRVPKK
jgi:hypothetical protein